MGIAVPMTTEPIAPGDPLAPLWEKATEAAKKNDMAGMLFVWKALADKGIWHLCAGVGEIYERGSEGVERDINEAIRWYNKGVFLGDDPLAHVGIGRVYCNGTGVDRDYSVALVHFKRAAEYGQPEANLYLGNMYFEGIGVKRDTLRAEGYYHVAASAGYPIAYGYLARLAIRHGKLFKAIEYFIRGLKLANAISRKNPADTRLFEIAEWSKHRS